MTKVEIEITYDNNETKYNVKALDYGETSNKDEVLLAGSFADMIKRILENMNQELKEK